MAEVRAYSKKLDSRRNDKVQQSIQRLANAVFAESQKNVPTSSGYLKDSGKVYTSANRIVLHYKAPYADEIENGRKGLSGGYRTPSGRGTTFGRTHETFYDGGLRPVPIGVRYDEQVPVPAPGDKAARANSPWRVLDLSADLEPRHFIQNAFVKIFGDGRRKGSLEQVNPNMVKKK